MSRFQKLQHTAHDGVLAIIGEQRGVHHRHQVCRNLENQPCDQKRPGAGSAVGLALVDGRLAARASMGGFLTDLATGVAPDDAFFVGEGDTVHEGSTPSSSHSRRISRPAMRMISTISMAMAHKPTPGCTSSMPASLTIATRIPSRQTSSMLQGRKCSRARMHILKPGAILPL